MEKKHREFAGKVISDALKKMPYKWNFNQETPILKRDKKEILGKLYFQGKKKGNITGTEMDKLKKIVNAIRV